MKRFIHATEFPETETTHFKFSSKFTFQRTPFGIIHTALTKLIYLHHSLVGCRRVWDAMRHLFASYSWRRTRFSLDDLDAVAAYIVDVDVALLGMELFTATSEKFLFIGIFF